MTVDNLSKLLLIYESCACAHKHIVSFNFVYLEPTNSKMICLEGLPLGAFAIKWPVVVCYKMASDCTIITKGTELHKSLIFSTTACFVIL